MPARWVPLPAAVICLAAVLVAVTATPEAIPNVDRVPNPCQPNTTWPGVGYKDVAGRGGERNPFGVDLDKYNKVWTADLCHLDSDGDGMSNGQELGDPSCTWTPTAGPRLDGGIAIHHPGICEPITGDECKQRNAWLKCETFSCPAFSLPTTLPPKNLQVPSTSVLPGSDSYFCVGLSLPTDSEYHIIGAMPLLTTNLVHDLVLYGCDPTFDGNQVNQLKPCFRGLPNCRTPIAAWGAGEPGQCFADDYGLPMGGQTGYRHAVVQVHWRNPVGQQQQQDNSGFKLYYTRTPRPHPAQILRIGQAFLDLPPGLDRVTASGNCMHQCTSKMSHNVRIASAMLRMNALGQSGDIKHYRGGKAIKTLIDDPNYDFNLPNIASFNESLEFLPGDELRVNCVYRTKGKVTVTNRGETSNDEACLGFVTIHTAINDFGYCVQWKDLPHCQLDANVAYQVQHCDIDTFEVMRDLTDRYCNSSCTNACKVLVRGFQDSGCNRDTVAEYITEFYVKTAKSAWREKLQLIQQCSQGTNSGGGSGGGSYNSASAPGLLAGGAVLLTLLATSVGAVLRALAG